VICEDDRVTVRWTWTGTHTKPFNGFGPTGRQYTNSGMAVFQLRDGKIVHAWLQTDRLGFLQQLGVVPTNLGVAPPARQAPAAR